MKTGQIPALHSALRAATAPAHARLESSLALIIPPLSRDRFLAALRGFWGFHVVWEPLLAKQPALAPLLAGRGKRAALEIDLAAFGMPPAAVQSLPLCHEANGLDGSAERLLGGMYVLEGATLGGQVIDRALQGQSWLPKDGLQYFTPYGSRIGAMWQDFRAGLEAASSPEADPVIIAGALDTFAVLQNWLCGTEAA